MATTTESTVGEIVRAQPARARVFERLGIDYCCGGKKPLHEACLAKGLDPETVVAMLDAMDLVVGDTGAPDPAQLSLSALCDHIEQVHHAYLREELPRLDFMTQKVASRHGEHEPRLFELRRTFEEFSSAMIAHTREEEQQIFPAIRLLDANQPAECRSLKEAITKLEAEHDQAGSALARFSALTDGYSPPEWACNTFRALYDSLASMERETHQHVHKENNVLFPRALAAAAR
ncbi:MAG: iron-sulfur cluster repair di-iron protein [Opitutaceae bacterium]|nr:iron-sulfur cluster repair di-iron protein [Opitutaceae bacterium]